jgi:hypothetical protein
VPNPLLDCLDAADPNVNTPVRNTTITALQALALLNDAFVIQQAGHFSARLRMLSDDLRRQVEVGLRPGVRPTAAGGRAGRAGRVRRRTRPGQCLPVAVQYQRVRIRRLTRRANEGRYPTHRPIMTRQASIAGNSCGTRGAASGGIALAHLLGAEGCSPPRRRSATEGRPRRAGCITRARARRVVQLFMSGRGQPGRHVRLQARADRRGGQPFDPGGKVELFQSAPGAVMPSPWAWKPHGECGKYVSGLLPHLATCVDDMAFLPAMSRSRTCTGRRRSCRTPASCLPGFPSMGAWVSYGLGSENEDLPAFVALPDARGFAPNGPANWGAGFLPATFQGTTVRAGTKNPIHDLFPPEGTGDHPRGRARRPGIIEQLNREHASTREGDTRLDARISTYELAARLQLSAPEVLDLAGESRATSPCTASTSRSPRISAATA